MAQSDAWIIMSPVCEMELKHLVHAQFLVHTCWSVLGMSVGMSVVTMTLGHHGIQMGSCEMEVGHCEP